MLVCPGKTQMLFMASSRNWYSTPCVSPVPEPSSTISMKIPQATLKAVRTERSLLLRMVSRISCQVSRSNIGAAGLDAGDRPEGDLGGRGPHGDLERRPFDGARLGEPRVGVLDPAVLQPD